MNTCEKCTEPFDLKGAPPVLLSCCDDTCCLRCWKTGFSVETFTCPYRCGLANQENPQTHRLNKAQVKKLSDFVTVFCAEHPDEEATHLHRESHTFLCRQCISAKTKLDGLERINPKKVAEECRQMIGQLQKLRDEAKKVIDRADGCFGARQHGGEMRQLLVDGLKIVRVPQEG